MMKTIFKKYSACILAAIIITLLATACSSQPSTTTVESVTTPASQSSSPENKSTMEPIKVVMFNNSGGYGGAGSEAGSSQESIKLIHDKILEETNVDLTSICVPGSEQAAKLATLLSSNESLDIWWANWSTYSSDGIIQPINQYLDLYGPDVKAVWDAWDAWDRCIDVDGNIWAVPRYTQFASYFTFVRTDWLAKLGMEMPTNLDEFENYLYAVKAADFYGNGETIPLIGRGGNVGASFEWAMLGGFTNSGNSIWLDDAGNVMPKILQPGYKDFIVKLAQWYKDGIIHKENFGWDTAKVRDTISSGRVGASMAYYVDVSQFQHVMQQNNPEAEFAHYEKGLTGPNGQLIQTLNPGSSKQMLFSAKADEAKMAAIMELVNWSFKDWTNFQTVCRGKEDVHWEYDTSVVDLDTAKKTQVVKAIANSGYFGDFSISIGLPYESVGVAYNPNGTRYLHNLYLSEYLGDFDICKETLDARITFNSTELSDNIPASSDMTTYANEELIKFVNGERDLTTWDEFIETYKSLGLDSWSKEYTRQYNLLTKK